MVLFVCFTEGVGERGRGEASPDLAPLKRLPDQRKSNLNRSTTSEVLPPTSDPLPAAQHNDSNGSETYVRD
ncbi:hypothetical protein E2C01_091427 [Portunus trituberculatus]|uniref:Uncharacterized protein n=1 Tax=Portunus trituberculatus TaxID=210409 RepID=A0A5B7JNJ7_PORTR|nr:hypothetical protein [Portunus trituberculatus]